MIEIEVDQIPEKAPGAYRTPTGKGSSGVPYFTAPSVVVKVESGRFIEIARDGLLARFLPPRNPPMSAKQSHTKYQQKIIKNYYDNRSAISLQRLGELVTDLYLAEGKARQTKWKQAVAALEKLGLGAQRIGHLREKDDPALLAKVVEEMMAKDQ